MVMRRPILVSNQTKLGGKTSHDRLKCYQRAGEKATVVYHRRGSDAEHVAVDHRKVHGD